MLEWLKTILGESYTDELDSKISEEIGKSFVSKNDFNTKNETLKGLQSQIKDRDRQLEELRKVDSEGLQAEITRLQELNKNQQNEFSKQINELKMNNAIDSTLKDAGAKNLRAVKALLDSSNLKLNDDGTIEGLQSQIETLLKASDSSFLFASSGTAVNNLKSITPAASSDPQTSGAEAKYTKMYAEAKTPTEKIRIKREAYENGVLLN